MARSERESVIRHPLTAIFGVDANVRVLRVLARHGGLLSASEIVRRSRLSRESVRAGLLTLASLGIVAPAGSGRSRLYGLNDSHCLAGPVSALFRAESERFAAILSAVRQTAGEIAAVSLFIYGSAARGDDTPNSDLDIGVIAPAQDLAGTVDGLRQRLRPAAAQLSFVPNVVGLDLDDVRRLAQEHDPWWKNVTEDALVIAGKRPEEAAALHGVINGQDGILQEQGRRLR